MRILIVDDEPLARKRLGVLLEEIEETDLDIEIVGEAVNGEEGLAMALSLEPDVILLDIRMPGLDGLQVARHLSSMGEAPSIIFTTAYDEHALAAFDAQAVGYLLKPIRQQKLIDSLKRAAQLSDKQIKSLDAENIEGVASGPRDRFCINKRGELTIIPMSEIRYFMADQKYVSLYLYKNNTWQEEIIDETLKELESELEDTFLRVHRNALVAKEYIDKLSRDEDGHYHVHLRNLSEPISVSRRQVKEVKTLLKK